jgi:hypothetical protein
MIFTEELQNSTRLTDREERECSSHTAVAQAAVLQARV